MIRTQALIQAVARGLLPEDIAQEFEDWSDVQTARVHKGELTEEELVDLSRQRARADADRGRARGYPRGPALASVLASVKNARGQA